MLIDSGEMKLIRMNFSLMKVVKPNTISILPSQGKRKDFFISALKKREMKCQQKKIQQEKFFKNVQVVWSYIEHPEKMFNRDDRVMLVPSSFPSVLFFLSGEFLCQAGRIFARIWKERFCSITWFVFKYTYMKKEERLLIQSWSGSRRLFMKRLSR